jgi:long-subunit fatty acid transport protein
VLAKLVGIDPDVAMLADIYRLGVAFIIKPGTEIEVGATYSTWSRLQAFDVDFKVGELIDDFKVPKNGKDTWNFRFGVEVALTNWLSVRTGYQFDQGSVPTDFVGPGGVELDRHQIGAGVSFYAWGMEVDLGYQHVFQPYVKAGIPADAGGLGDARGEYWSSFDFFAIAFNWNFNDFARSLKGEKPKYRKKEGWL